MFGSKAILGMVGGTVAVGVGGSYLLLSPDKLFSKKKSGSFCVAVTDGKGGFGSCLQTFKEEDQFKNYLESFGKNVYGSTAAGLDDALEKARKAYEEGLVAFVYLDNGTQNSGAKWVFPDQEAWRKEYLKKSQ
ncbi:hypothetical protein MHC_01445 [Mycoplasma haemocanis str. Illinois]|uniref:Uncharacterized protein n=1 Tax=Mycoplasma haemocanis (strain Illinois) TaxID=1111676 RepID=H6N683_MYCHN|nr:hypothetical protein [Mycoplasma haemocanis]AEW45155.1 hypothetical protein MHC_01445 [Mycoplasma haemocanis str. Illinois]